MSSSTIPRPADDQSPTPSAKTANRRRRFREPPTLTVSEPCKTRAKRACGRVYRVVSSTFGLIVILIAYSFLGAAIFYVVENTASAAGGGEGVIRAAAAARADLLRRLWNLSSHHNVTSEEQFVREGTAELREYEREIRELVAGDGDHPAPITEWDFWGSLLFCLTVLTTIGYGHVSPSTDFGRIFTMIYALFGIPLWLVAMADIGKKITIGLKFLWVFVRRFYYTGRCKKVRKSIPMQTIREGLGQLYPGRFAQDGSSAKNDDDDDNPKHFEVDDQFNLPPVVALLLLILYILIGMLIYPQWETNWSYLEAFYFLFISVSTIGFGDVLPDHKDLFLASFVYIIVGLSLVAMTVTVFMDAFNSTLTAAKSKLNHYGQKHGIDLSDSDVDEALSISSVVADDSSSPHGKRGHTADHIVQMDRRPPGHPNFYLATRPADSGLALDPGAMLEQWKQIKTERPGGYGTRDANGGPEGRPENGPMRRLGTESDPVGRPGAESPTWDRVSPVTADDVSSASRDVIGTPSTADHVTGGPDCGGPGRDGPDCGGDSGLNQLEVLDRDQILDEENQSPTQSGDMQPCDVLDDSTVVYKL